jgi:hypothetical protein
MAIFWSAVVTSAFIYVLAWSRGTMGAPNRLGAQWRPLPYALWPKYQMTFDLGIATVRKIF